MALIQPPGFLQTSTSGTPAEAFRRSAQAAVFQGYGVIDGLLGQLQVTANGTPNMSVNVAGGQGMLPGTQSPTYQGVYDALNDATVNLSVASADPTNPRHDLVCLSIQDTQYGGAGNLAVLSVVTGSPAPTPSDPVAPANSITLARLQVNAGVSSIVAGNVTDLRPFISTTAQLEGQIVRAGGAQGGGAQATTRWVGGTQGANPTGLSNAGDWVEDVNGFFRHCVSGGTPGTWYSNGLVKIAEVLLTVNTGAINWTSIPQTFNHLLIYYRAAQTSGVYQALAAQFNSDTNYDYAGGYIYASGGPGGVTPGGATYGAATPVSSARVGGAINSGSGWSAGRVDIVHYIPGAATPINLTAHEASWIGGSTFETVVYGAVWNPSVGGGQITSIYLTCGGGNSFIPGSYFCLLAIP